MIKECVALLLLACATTCFADEQANCSWRLNSSNKGKLQEFQRLFAKYGCTLTSTEYDLKEIEADHVTVVAHKASQLDEGILIEDTALEIEGAAVGVNVRWVLDHLDEYVGRKAVWTVLLAYRRDGKIYIYRGDVEGTVTEPHGDSGFGFDPLFLPMGSSKTLAEDKPDEVNARALAVKALLEDRLYKVVDPIEEWTGPWQNDDH